MTMKFMEEGLRFGRTWVDRIMGKVDKDQGVANAGKVLGVGEDGNVTLKDIVIPVGKSYALKTTSGSTSSPIFKTNASMITVDNVEGYLFSTNFQQGNAITDAELEYIGLNGTNYYASKVNMTGSTGTTISDLGIYYFTESIGNSVKVAVWVPTDVLGEATSIYVNVTITSCYLEEA